MAGKAIFRTSVAILWLIRVHIPEKRSTPRAATTADDAFNRLLNRSHEQHADLRANLSPNDRRKPMELTTRFIDAVSLARDWQELGDSLWTRFNARQVGSRWYYENVAYALLEAEAAPVQDLAKKLGELGWEAREWAMPEGFV